MASDAFFPFPDGLEAALAAGAQAVVQPGGSDSAILDNVFEAMVGVGRTLPMVKSMLIPDVWAERETR